MCAAAGTARRCERGASSSVRNFHCPDWLQSRIIEVFYVRMVPVRAPFRAARRHPAAAGAGDGRRSGIRAPRATRARPSGWSLLQTYLPQRYQAASAHVVDSEGTFSQQIDVVVFDRQYSPFIFKFQGQTVVPAESVYAVFEAKQAITR